MYRCDVCDCVVAPNTACLKLVVETRPRVYPHRTAVHFVPGRDGGKGRWVDDPGGHGHETVREARACAGCAAQARPG